MKTDFPLPIISEAETTGDQPKFPASVSPIVEQFMRQIGPPNKCVTDETVSMTGVMMCQIMMLNSVIERRGNRLLEEHGLTLPQWLALGCISHAGEEGIAHSQIGARLMLSKAPITGTVDRLVRAGLVERRGDARDRRISLAVVTPKGLEMWWQVKKTLRSNTDDSIENSLTLQEQETLLGLMGRVLDALRPNAETEIETS